MMTTRSARLWALALILGVGVLIVLGVRSWPKQVGETRSVLGALRHDYLPGEPVIVPIELRGLRAGEPLMFGDFGDPAGRELVVIGPEGERLDRRSADQKGVSRPGHVVAGEFVKHLEQRATGPDETFLLKSNLSDSYRFGRPGVYTAQLCEAGGGKLLAESRFRVLPTETIQTINDAVVCSRPEGPDDHFGTFGGVSYEMNVVRTKTAADHDPRWFCTVGEVQYQPDSAQNPYRVRSRIWIKVATTPEASIAKQVLDHRWRLWAILEADERRTLIVFDLRTGDARTIEPWGSEPIELGATLWLADMGAPILFVIGGRNGKPKVTTSSLDLRAYKRPDRAGFSTP